MSDKDTLAFPGTTENGLNNGVSGMALRDYFAARVMQALLANLSDRVLDHDIVTRSFVADAMMEERNRCLY
jgi:hypothetical protein